MKECIGKQIKTFSFLKDRHGREREPEREPREMFAPIELTDSIQSWIPKRLKTIDTCRSLADQLHKHDKNVHIAKVSGSSFSIAGFVLIAVGFGLAPVTLGTSTILSAVGGAVCAGGGTTAAGSSLAKIAIFKTRLAQAQVIIDADRQAQESVAKRLDELLRKESKLKRLKHLRKCFKFSTNMLLLTHHLGKCAKAGSRAAAAAGSDGAEAALRSIGIAGNAARIGMFTFSAVLLPFDIYTLVTSAMNIKSHGEDEPEEVKRLKDKADELERELNEWLEFVYELNSTHMEEDSVDVTRQCGLTVWN